MTELELRQLIETIEAPLLLADAKGMVIAESLNWASVQKTMGASAWAALKKFIKQVGISRMEERWKSAGLELLATPVGDSWVLLQLSGESKDAMREYLEDAMQSNASYQEKLSNFGIKNCIASSEKMIRIFTKAKQVAAYPTTILDRKSVV